jgi:purine-binding chemotaxis protein CheW
LSEDAVDQAPPSHQTRPLLEALGRAGEAAVAQEQAGEVELFCVDIDGALFGIESGLIQEVVRVPPITPLPNAPAFLLGVATHRGDVVGAVDLARLLGRGETKVGARTRMAVARAEGMVVALLADQVMGLRTYPASAVKPAPLGAEGSEFISGIVFAGRSTNILDLRRALSSARERATSRR